MNLSTGQASLRGGNLGDVMGTLEYQNREESNREERARRRTRWFGPSRSNQWEAMAAEIGARFVAGEKVWRDKMIRDFGPWQIVLENRSGNEEVLQVRAPFVNRDGFRFAVSPITFGGLITAALGAQDVTLGYPELDHQMIVKTNNQARVRELFATEQLRELVRLHVLVHVSDGFYVRPAQSAQWAKNVDELYYRVQTEISDPARLRSIFDLFEVTLRQLQAMGTAASE